MTTPMAGLRETNIPGAIRYAQGKVRDIYALGNDRLLIVSTDRLSAFDVVLPSVIPDRGKVLTQLSAYWFGKTKHIISNHLLAVDVADFPEELRRHSDVLQDRSMLVRRTKRIDVECVARGYLAGSAWSEYRRQGTACGIPLPSGLVESQELPAPIFTPAVKADKGHDENISYEQLVSIIGAPLAERLREVTLAVYSHAASVARERGIIIADTKMEFGLLPRSSEIEGTMVRNAQDGAEGTLILIDELLTPDSSRFWDAASYRPGSAPASFDKQYVRDWLETSGWDKQPPGPDLPEEVVLKTREKYMDALRRLTGKTL